MSNDVELTLENLLEGLAGEIRSPDGPGEFTKAYNENLIAQFRANDGKLPGDMAGSNFLLLTTTGAKSGKQRTTPLAFIPVEGKILLIASKGGALTNPAWYANLVANPEVGVELPGETYRALAVTIEGAERDRLYGEVASRIPTFADYQRRTDRVIPVVELQRITGA